MIPFRLTGGFALSQSLLEREATGVGCAGGESIGGRSIGRDLAKADIEIPASIMACAKKRVNDYVAGRFAAHQAIANHSSCHSKLHSQNVTRHENGMPCWPGPFVGSITHTEKFAWAVVGLQSELAGIGVDCEQVVSRRTSLEISELVATRNELDLLQTKFGLEAALTLCFSAKEAVYKSLNPITNWPIDFRDLTVTAFSESALKIQLQPSQFDYAKTIVVDVDFELFDNHVFSLALFPQNQIAVDLVNHISSRQFQSIRNRSTVASV